MQSLIFAFFAATLLLVGLLIYRLVNSLSRRFRKRRGDLPPVPAPTASPEPNLILRDPESVPPVPATQIPVVTTPTLMRVGQVTPLPVEGSLSEKTSNATEATPSKVVAQTPASTTRYLPGAASVGSTRMFSVEQLRDRSSAAEHAAVDPSETPMAGTGDYAFGQGLTPFFAAALPETATRKQELKHDLVRAGYYQPHAYENIQAVRWLFLVLPLIVLCCVINFLPPQVEFWVIGTGLAMAILGWALPKLYIASQAADRRSEIERSLPDVLDMLNMCVSQGMTLIHSLKRVTQELGSVFPALSQELRIVAEQAELGTLEQALINFSHRVDAPDVHSFTSLVIQTERMGTSISVALGDYAENMRESLKQRADEKANRATFQLLFPTVLFLMPSVYIFLLGPSIIKLTEFFSGTTTVNQPANAGGQQ